MALMIIWGINFSVTKTILDQVSVGAMLFVRFLWMMVLGLAMIAWLYRGRLRRSLPNRRDLPRFIGAGLLGHTAHVGLVTWGLQLSTPFSSSLVLTSGPLWTLLILAALGAEKLRPAQVVGTVAAFLGILLFMSDKFASGVLRAGLGDLVLLVAAGLFSLYTVVARPLTSRYGAPVLLAYTLLFGAPPVLLFTLPWLLAEPWAALPLSIWLWMFYAVTISSFLGWLGWAWINQVRGVGRSAPLMYMMPPIAGLVSWITLGETFTWIKITGALVTMAGVAWAQFGGGLRHAVSQADSG
ncbi:MAG: DMT family transporter [Proteobacteria bacterium]|nr:DMT family transporter [Pseudomonadota bacterium]